jgi:hypothetical protein
VECGVGKLEAKILMNQGGSRCARRLHHHTGAARAPPRLPGTASPRNHFCYNSLSIQI